VVYAVVSTGVGPPTSILNSGHFAVVASFVPDQSGQWELAVNTHGVAVSLATFDVDAGN
jgi:hypothetical protein